MKKRIQKYLAGEREGFSLVELIIVIAIMAILIGVIALAVIPNIQRSRESKDISMLDSLASAANAAIANNQVSASTDTTVTLYTLASGVATKVTSPSKLQKAIYDTVAANAGNVGSGAAQTGTKIELIYNTGTGTGAAKITVQIADASGVVKCKYLSEPEEFKVSN